MASHRLSPLRPQLRAAPGAGLPLAGARNRESSEKSKLCVSQGFVRKGRVYSHDWHLHGKANHHCRNNNSNNTTNSNSQTPGVLDSFGSGPSMDCHPVVMTVPCSPGSAIVYAFSSWASWLRAWQVVNHWTLRPCRLWHCNPAGFCKAGPSTRQGLDPTMSPLVDVAGVCMKSRCD